ncbi:hypothetical protein TNCV_5035421 [Trichonephila clavipes]|nr:hypothetical protein TNCV_5035421 [Trichonephila clavipes]
MPNFNLNQPSASSVARQIRENKAQDSSNPPSDLRGFRYFQPSIWEMNLYHDKNQLSVSEEFNPTEYCDIETNPNSEANNPVLKYAHEDKQYRIPSLSCMNLNNMDLNLEKYSKTYPRNLNSFVRSNVVYECILHFFSLEYVLHSLERECNYIFRKRMWT